MGRAASVFRLPPARADASVGRAYQRQDGLGSQGARSTADDLDEPNARHLLRLEVRLGYESSQPLKRRSDETATLTAGRASSSNIP